MTGWPQYIDMHMSRITGIEVTKKGKLIIVYLLLADSNVLKLKGKKYYFFLQIFRRNQPINQRIRNCQIKVSTFRFLCRHIVGCLVKRASKITGINPQSLQGIFDEKRPKRSKTIKS